MKGNHVNLITSALCLLLVICNLCGIIGICHLFLKNKRQNMINDYNVRVSEWNMSGVYEIMESNFELSIDNDTIPFDTETKGYGDYYPYRDTCDKHGDPACLQSPVYYYQSSFKTNAHNATVTVRDVYSDEILFSEQLILYGNMHLYKKDINCIGGNEDSCAKECKKRQGEWNKGTNTCFIHMFFNKICLRINYHNDSNSWYLDQPPTWPLGGSDVSYGCVPQYKGNLLSYINSSSWLPFLYTTSQPDNITVILRHYQDPFISAAAITNGCSSNSDSAAVCFGRSRHEDRKISIILLSVCVFGVIVELMLLLISSILKHQGKEMPLWLSPFRFMDSPGWNDEVIDEKMEETKGKGNEVSQELTNTNSQKDSNNSASIDMYMPLMQMRQDPESEEESISTAIQQTSDYDMMTSNFQGDEDGI